MIVVGVVFAVIAGLAIGGAPLADHLQWSLGDAERVALGLLGWVAGLGGALMIALGWRYEHHLSSTTIFDFKAGKLRRGRTAHPLSKVSRVYVQPSTVGDTELVRLVVCIDDATINLTRAMQARHAAGLANVADFIQQTLARSGVPVSADVTTDEVKDNAALIGLIFLGLGLAWAALGALFGRDLVFVLDDKNGLIVWPFGLWLAAIGLADRLGLPVVRTLLEGRMRVRAPLLLLLAGSYLALCLRPLH